VLLHSSATSSRQWRKLIGQLEDRFACLAVNLIGYGGEPLPRDTAAFDLAHVVARCPDRFHLIGHSYGGAVAFTLAHLYPDRALSLLAHEPVLFSLLRVHGEQELYARIAAEATRFRQFVEAGDNAAAARLFINHWSGPGAWEKIPEARKPQFAATSPKVVLDFQALLSGERTAAEFANLTIPWLVTCGTETPLPARRVAELLCAPVYIEGAGHMAPIAQAEKFHQIVEDFLRRVA
jgi:pimeloyl-ACP methyl ester carboxylesterase